MRTHLFLLTAPGTGVAMSLVYTETPILPRALMPGRPGPRQSWAAYWAPLARVCSDQHRIAGTGP